MQAMRERVLSILIPGEILYEEMLFSRGEGKKSKEEREETGIHSVPVQESRQAMVYSGQESRILSVLRNSRESECTSHILSN